jgi:CheY-like chemotaxis protein
MADKPLIMVVDDEREFANNIAETIRKTEKYEAIAVYSSEEAFSELGKNKPLLGFTGNKIKLILLDIKMPDMDGLQFLAAMRKKYNEEEIGVIMLTAYEDAEKWERATSASVAGYLKKTETSTQLLPSIERFFAGPDKRNEMTLETFEKHINKMDEWEKGTA